MRVGWTSFAKMTTIMNSFLKFEKKLGFIFFQIHPFTGTGTAAAHVHMCIGTTCSTCTFYMYVCNYM